MPLFKITPACKDYLWGGDKLRSDFGVQSQLHPLAEAWVFSAHPDGPSRLSNGQTLPEYLAENPLALGSSCRSFEQCPVLIKLIDARDNLSIQVHPDDTYAWEHEGQYGKSEMWVVLDAEPGAYLYCGFEHTISRQELKERIAQNTLTEVLHAVPVQKGDSIFIPAGTVHAICKGIVVAEVQQNSNVTYRVYDYDRRNADGIPRPLHIAKAMDVACLGPAKQEECGGHLGQCRYFTADFMHAPFGEKVTGASFVHFLVTEGSGEISCGQQTMQVKKGDSIFAPSDSGLCNVSGDCTVLRTKVGA